MQHHDPHLSAEQSELVERLARFIVARKLTVPALVFLESVRPLNVIGGQMLHFLSPLASMVFDTAHVESLADFLQRRESIDVLIESIEALEAKESGKASRPANSAKGGAE